jgi:3-hydroxyisobutyrate dehydrogenase
MKSVAVLGLGIMGAGMAHNLIKAGFSVAVYNRTRSKGEPLAAQGARIADTPRDAAHDADLIIAMVGDDAASRSVWLGEDGAIAGAKAGAILVDSSTLSVEWVQELAAYAKQQGFDFLDAPVSGSKEAAETGTLKLMIGGDPEVIERARPALEAISELQVHFGPNGSGATIKLINNMMGAVQVASFAEGLILAERAGLDVQAAADYLLNGAPGSPMIKGRASRLLEHNYDDPHFALKWMHKDTTYALRAADQFGSAMPILAAAREVYRLARNRGFDEADMAAVIEAFRNDNDQ